MNKNTITAYYIILLVITITTWIYNFNDSDNFTLFVFPLINGMVIGGLLGHLKYYQTLDLKQTTKAIYYNIDKVKDYSDERFIKHIENLEDEL